MKAKLLKKIRKRFAWHFQKEGKREVWTLYDKSKNLETTILSPFIGETMADMAIRFMMREIGVSGTYYFTNETRKYHRIKERKNYALRVKWNNL